MQSFERLRVRWYPLFGFYLLLGKGCMHTFCKSIAASPFMFVLEWNRTLIHISCRRVRITFTRGTCPPEMILSWLDPLFYNLTRRFFTGSEQFLLNVFNEMPHIKLMDDTWLLTSQMLSYLDMTISCNLFRYYYPWKNKSNVYHCDQGCHIYHLL